MTRRWMVTWLLLALPARAEGPLRTNRAGTAEHFTFAREGERWRPVGFLCEREDGAAYVAGPLADLRGPEDALRAELTLTTLRPAGGPGPMSEKLSAREPRRWACDADGCHARYDPEITLHVRRASPGSWEDRLALERGAVERPCAFVPHRYASCLTATRAVYAVEREGQLMLQRVDLRSGQTTTATGGQLSVEGERYRLQFGALQLEVSGDPGAPDAALRPAPGKEEPCLVYVVSPTFLAQRLPSR